MQHLETRVEVVGTTRVLTKEEQKPGKMIEVIKKLASEIDFTRQPLVKLEASSLKDIKINRQIHLFSTNYDNYLKIAYRGCHFSPPLRDFR